MPNLNMQDDFGGRPPVQPMMSRGGGGGGFKKFLLVLFLLLLAGGGYYLYQSGTLSSLVEKIPFLSKKATPSPTTEVIPPEQSVQTPAPAETSTPMLNTPPSPVPQPVTPEPTPMKQTTGTGEFTVVIASFLSKKSADDEAARWSNAGFQSMVSEKHADGETWYRVSVGRYETRQLAAQAAKNMEHMFESGYWVEKIQ